MLTHVVPPRTTDKARTFLAYCRAEQRGWPHSWHCLLDTAYEYKRTTALARVAVTALRRTDMVFEHDRDDMLLALEEIGERLTREGETLLAALDRVDAYQAAEQLLGVKETSAILLGIPASDIVSRGAAQ